MGDPALFRVERFDAGWGGFRNDDLTPRGLTLGRALRTAREASQQSSARQRVVSEASGEVVAVYEANRRLADGQGTQEAARAHGTRR